MIPRPRPGNKAYRAMLRARLAALGFDESHVVEQVAIDLIRRCGKRAREAWRLAAELSLDGAAARYNTILGDPRMPMRKGRIWDFEQWPGAGARPTVRVLKIMAQIYGTSWIELVDLDDLTHMPEPDRDAYHATTSSLRRQPTFRPPQLVKPTIAVTPTDPDLESTRAPAERVLEAAAEESAELATWAGDTNVDDDHLAELDRCLRAIAHAYVYGAPYPLLLRTRQLRSRVRRLLLGRQSPRHSRDLYLMGARACTLLAWMTGDLGNYLAAGDHASAAWLCAQLADHNGARTWARATASKLAYWSGDYVQSAQLAAHGLTYQPADSAAVLLALLEARALARLGRVQQAKESLNRWLRERDAVPGPDEVGGVLGVSEAQQHYLAGSTYLELRQPGQALKEAHRSIVLFEETPLEKRFYGAEMLARIDGVRAHLEKGELDAAQSALQPVLALAPKQRLDTFVSNLGHVRALLANPQYRGGNQAQQLQEHIEDYCSSAIGKDLESHR